MKDRKKPEKFWLPHGMPSDDRAFAFSSRVFPKASQIKTLYKLWHYQNTSAKWDESDGCQPDRSARASGSIRAYHGCQTRCADCCGAFLLRAVVEIVRATGPERTYTQSRTSGHRGERNRLCPVAADQAGAGKAKTGHDVSCQNSDVWLGS